VLRCVLLWVRQGLLSQIEAKCPANRPLRPDAGGPSSPAGRHHHHQQYFRVCPYSWPSRRELAELGFKGLPRSNIGYSRPLLGRTHSRLRLFEKSWPTSREIASGRRASFDAQFLQFPWRELWLACAADIQPTTQPLETAAAVYSILLEYVIIGRGGADPLGRGYYSLREAGLS
jgi:hypothetical protein